MTLSKSKIMAYRQCPKRLWLAIHRPDKEKISQAAQSRFRDGNQIGEIARTIYDPDGQGTLIDPQQESFAEAFKRTQLLLMGDQPIFEGAFTAGNALALADVMLKEEQGWHMIEVKSSTSAKDYHREDAAIQTHIVNATGVALEKVSLAHVDNQFVYQGDGRYDELLKLVDVTDEVKTKDEEVAGWIAEASELAESPVEPQIARGAQCKKPFECAFVDYCRALEPAAIHPVEWLPNVATNVLRAHLARDNVREMEDVPDDLLNATQLRVKHHTLEGAVYFNAEGAAEELQNHAWPLYFLDFESINFAVPIWSGRRPYEMVVFQYSLHKLDENGELSHHEYLDLSGNDPARQLAEALVRDCGDTGTIYVYNKSFESARIKELARQFPDLEQALMTLEARLYDLMATAKNHFYDPSQKGSWSIKNVLPAIAQGADQGYDQLEGVRDGGMAMVAFEEAIALDEDDVAKRQKKDELLAYCNLDTAALVELWEFFLQGAVSQSTEAS